MTDEIRINRPTPAGGMASSPAVPSSPVGGNKTPWIILGAVVVVIVILGVLFRDRLFGSWGSKPLRGQQASSQPSGYQAVFLTNGQVYFGKIANAESTYVTLTDIYYLQVIQPPLQGQQEAGQQAPAQQPQPQISLVKLGNELHGPVDEMKINRDHIMFYENLKENGQVVQAIRQFQANPPAQQQQQPQPQQQQQQQQPQK